MASRRQRFREQSEPARRGRWRSWHCLWIFKLCMQTVDTVFSSFMKCLLLEFFISVILGENRFLFFPRSQPYVTNSQNLALRGTSLLKPFTSAHTFLSSEFNSFPEVLHRTSLAAQWLTLCASSARGTGSTPGQGNKIPHAAWCGQEKFLMFCTENEP